MIDIISFLDFVLNDIFKKKPLICWLTNYNLRIASVFVPFSDSIESFPPLS
nr:MAG TPA: hypothetical protein [Caudoviricetes sp.]